MVKNTKKQKRYVVWEGKNTGIFSTWVDCEKTVKGFSGAKYKSFESIALAQQAYSEGSEKYYSTSLGGLGGNKRKKKINWEIADLPFEKKSIAVDAACSGNPGVMEYQGIDLQSGKQIFYKKLDNGTNNIGEFLALVHALGYLKENYLDNIFIYTDSKIAMSWVEQKKCKTQANISENLKQIIIRAEDWLENNYFSDQAKRILKRKTNQWGEIPADFGRK